MAEQFTLSLAGIPISIQVQYPETKDFCRKYLCNEKSSFSVCITTEDIIYEREKSEKQDLKEGGKIRCHSNEYLETLALYRKIANRLTEYKTLLVHGSAVAVDGQGYIFIAPSGTGKSTHVQLWRDMLGERSTIINDDKPLISQNESGVYIHGTPWCGKHNLNTNISVPLKAICVLTRGEKDYIESIDNIQAISVLLQQTYRPQSADRMHAVLSLIERLANNVQLYRLACTMNPTAAQIAFDTMSQNS